MKEEIKIRDRVIASGKPVFITAECGVTCNYDLNVAKQLINVVADAGADAIKFIFWFPEEIMSDKSITYTYSTESGSQTENMYEMLSNLTFTLDEWKDLKHYADQRGIILFSTVNSPGGIIYAEEIGLEAYKLSSWDFNYIPLWQEIVRKGKPLIIDTGPVNTLEVSKVLSLAKAAGNEQLLLVHCFHTESYEEMNMLSIPYLSQAFNTLSGFSATDYNDELDIVALSLGAVFLEKRLTLSRSMPGHHHILSKEPTEFKTYVAQMRNLQAALGVMDLVPSQGDLKERARWFRHVVASKSIAKGTQLTADMLTAKRPEAGLSPEFTDLLIGRVMKRDIKYNEAISLEDV